MLELTVLLISIVIVLLILYFKDNINIPATEEGFTNFYLSACPSGYKSFYNNDGDIVCCDGEIVANRCIADNQCTLNGKGTPDTPNCTDLIQRMYLAKSKEYCSSSMPNYFEDKGKNIKGCMSGPLNDTMTGPLKYTQPQCKIYSDVNTNTLSTDSCANQQLLDAAQCFGNNCTKELVQPISSAPPLVAIGFTDNSGMHRVAYTSQSMENYLNVGNPDWRNQGIDLTKNINVAEVAKAYYIDRTMDQSQIQF
jgi:hypothetical protein